MSLKTSFSRVYEWFPHHPWDVIKGMSTYILHSEIHYRITTIQTHFRGECDFTIIFYLM